VPREHAYWVYILSSKTRVLYVGVTNHLAWRVLQHKNGEGSAFTRRYGVTSLVYYEEFRYIRNAIRREKQPKSGSRSDKTSLIERVNPKWRDLAEDWN
jgi:putative endonuclease